MCNLTQGEIFMKKTLTGLTVLGVAVAAGLAFAQSDGGPGGNGPGGRSTDAPGQPTPPTTPDASSRNALPAITPAPRGASAPDPSTGTRAPSPDRGSLESGSTATQPEGSTATPPGGAAAMQPGDSTATQPGSAVSPAGQTRSSRSPRADRN
jgi:hypothetical protein